MDYEDTRTKDLSTLNLPYINPKPLEGSPNPLSKDPQSTETAISESISMSTSIPAPITISPLKEPLVPYRTAPIRIRFATLNLRYNPLLSTGPQGAVPCQTQEPQIPEHRKKCLPVGYGGIIAWELQVSMPCLCIVIRLSPPL